MHTTVWTKVKDVATREPVIVPPQMSLRVAAGMMAQHSIGALVIAVDGRTVGILSERDVVNALASGADPDEATVAGAMSHDVVSVDRKSTRLNSSHSQISYAVFCLKKKKKTDT